MLFFLIFWIDIKWIRFLIIINSFTDISMMQQGVTDSKFELFFTLFLFYSESLQDIFSLYLESSISFHKNVVISRF